MELLLTTDSHSQIIIDSKWKHQKARKLGAKFTCEVSSWMSWPNSSLSLKKCLVEF